MQDIMAWSQLSFQVKTGCQRKHGETCTGQAGGLHNFAQGFIEGKCSYIFFLAITLSVVANTLW